MMGLLIMLMPALGGSLYQCHAVGEQKRRLENELSASRLMAREVVGDLVTARQELQAREAQVERFVDANTLSGDEITRLRAAVNAWQRHNETLTQATERRINELAAYGQDAERKLAEARQQRESEMRQMEDDLTAARNQLSATSTELRETQNYAREAALWNEHLQRGMSSLRGSNQWLGQNLSSTQSALASAQSAVSSTESEAGSAEAERDRARRALGRAETVIHGLKREVIHERREEAREHNMALVRPPAAAAVASGPDPTPSRPPPAAPHPRPDPLGGRGRR